jgi:multidrug efflux pump subunit AcrA (membrane-fusion protein)
MNMDTDTTAARDGNSNGDLQHAHAGAAKAGHVRKESAMNVAGKRSLRWLVTGSLVVAVASVIAIAWSFRGHAADAASAMAKKDPEAEENAISVKSIRPRRDPSFQLTVEQPAFVEAYYQADLMARVAGPVKYLVVAIGDRVKEGERLVGIDVPDLEEDVRQKDAIITQRKHELEVAKAFEKTAAAAVEFARAMIPEKESDRQRAESVRSFREKELRRFTGLAAGGSPGVTADIVDERTQYYEAAVAEVRGAQSAIEKAKAGLFEAQAKLEAAHADVNLKASLIDVAKKDVDRAKAMLSFASIAAPFDGVVTCRNVDPGAFVQNAATAQAKPMLTVARTDIVTVYMKLPDNYAPFVTEDTEAVIQMGVLTGLKIRGKVTRFSRSLQTPEHDRTMRVEVDLFGGSEEEYRRFKDQAAATSNAALKGRTLPAFPLVNGKPSAGLQGKLLPGMFGTMRLTLQKFGNAWLVPSTALVSQGGRSFLYLVKDGKAVRVPVDVQVDDGRLAKVVLVEAAAGKEVRRDLTGEDTVIVSNQGELADGQAVKVTLSEW